MIHGTDVMSNTSSSATPANDFKKIYSEAGTTTCGERAEGSRSASLESEAFFEDAEDGRVFNGRALSDLDEQQQCCFSPTVTLLDSSLVGLSLCESESANTPEQELQFPSLAAMPVHRTKSILDLIEPARSFSLLSAPQVIQNICKANIPGWSVLDSTDIVVDQLLYGLSNQLFKVSVQDDYPNSTDLTTRQVLFRIYGKDVNTLYDSQVEVKIFKHLSALGIAPQLIAEFDGGRIEEWIEGCTLLRKDMTKSSVLLGVAACLAGIHLIHVSRHLDATSSINKFLSRWRDGAMEIYKSMQPDHPSYLAIRRLDLPRLYEESFRLHDYLFPPWVQGNEVTELRFCHNDIQENNIMVTETSLRLIDFEYSGCNYPAFDIASYFWEMTCDYCVDSYPFFRIDPTQYPLEEKRKLFCAMYLSKLTKTSIKISNHAQLNPVLDAVERFQLATHMLWGFWSVIRAPQAVTATSFDMLHYGQKRIDAYWAQKAKLLSQGKIS